MVTNSDPFRGELVNALSIKPVDSICRLQHAFLNRAIKIHPNQLKFLIGKEKIVYVLTSGNYELYRRGDNLRLFTAKAPHIFGLAEFLLPAGEKTYVSFSLDSKVHAISYFDVERELSQTPELWKDVAILLSFHLHYAYWRDLHLLNSSAYDAIKGKLLELEMATDAFRTRNSIADYILASTKISRSTIMKITKDLIEGGYIITSKGHLIKINHLPCRY